MTEYTDQEVVAAFNSCLDLKKYEELPDNVRERFEKLLEKNRIKAVCFMLTHGLGLRVYVDALPVMKVHASDDEVSTDNGIHLLHKGMTKGQLDLCGHWLRCPAELFKTKETFLVMSNDGRKYWRDLTGMEDDYEEDGTLEDGRKWDWTTGNSGRQRATKIDGRDKAQEIADEVKGIVIVP